MEFRQYRRDAFARKAQQGGYRSRAAFKLQELCVGEKLIPRGARVVDLGASPGSWSQVAVKLAGAAGLVVATDIVPMDPIAGVQFVGGDFREVAVRNAITDCLQGQPADLVMSDIAPNITGVRDTDAARREEILICVAEFTLSILKPGGSLLVKVFHGPETDAFRAQLKRDFATVVHRKPAASTASSSEHYLLARGFRR